jgi:hypothetical protein
MNITEEEGCLRDKRKKFIFMKEGRDMAMGTGITEGMDAIDKIEKNNKSIDFFGAFVLI